MQYAEASKTSIRNGCHMEKKCCQTTQEGSIDNKELVPSKHNFFVWTTFVIVKTGFCKLAYRYCLIA